MEGREDSALRSQDGPGEKKPGAIDETLALFVSSAPVALAMLDREMRYLAWSRDWAAYFGLEDGDLAGQPICDEVSDLCEAWRTALQRVFDGAECVSEEGRFQHADGRSAWLRWRITPVIGPRGDIVAVSVFTEDISDRKEAEQALHQSEQRLRLITASIGVGLFEKDFDSGKVFLSDGCVELLHLERDKAPHRLEEWFDLLDPADREACRAAFERALDPAGSRRFGCVVHPMVGGQQRSMQIQARVIFRKNGEGGLDAGARPERLIGFLIDQTESSRLQDALSKAQRLETVGRLAGVVAHDFNNILTVILSNLELAGLRSTDANLREHLDHAIEAAEMGAGFNKRLLALAGGRKGKPVALAVDEHISRTWDVFQRVLNDQVALRFDPGAPGAVVAIDDGELDGALLNLIVNARDAQPEGGQIDIRTRRMVLDRETASAWDGGRTGGFLRISVADNGSGMPEEVAKRAKEPFFTTKDRGRGTGLGLTSVTMTAERAEGFVHISTGPGAGTEVSIFLPLHDGPARSTEGESDDMPFGDGELVLVVEDDALVREVVMQRLEAIGYAVIEAANADVALDLLAAGEPVDLVFSDVVMPGVMSGFDLVEAVRRRHPEIAVLLSSGHASKAFREGVAQEQEVELLAKPYSLKTLAQAVARTLRPTATQA